MNQNRLQQKRRKRQAKRKDAQARNRNRNIGIGEMQRKDFARSVSPRAKDRPLGSGRQITPDQMDDHAAPIVGSGR